MDLARLAGGVLHHPDPAPAPVAFAAAELTAYLRRMFGTAPAHRPHPGDSGAWLCLAPAGSLPPGRALALPAGAEYAVHPAGETLVLAGARPRALLASVYALLEAAGCRWSPHGAEEEHVPGPAEAATGLPTLVARPAFVRRAYASDLATWHYTMPGRLAERLPADVAFVDWMAKSGATGMLFIRHANDTQWVVPELVPEFHRRGLEVEGGGHAMVELLPRTLFGKHPDYFPVARDGRRSDLGNVCVSSPEALAVVSERARAARAAIPGAADLHLWGLDLFGGGWCACSGCAALPPSDQALRVAQAVADRLGGAGRVFHLAYHDTLTPPRGRPGPQVWAEFAPRERCYAHPLADAECATNAPYWDALARHLEVFQGRVDVFEYYGDALLFGGCAVPLVEVIARDLESYAASGVRGVSCLLFGSYSLWAYGVNVEAFARGMLRPDAARGAREAYSRRWYGTAAEPMGRYLTRLERLVAGAVQHGDVRLPPRERNRARAAHDALAAILEDAPAVRDLLAAAGTAEAGSPLHVETHLLAYTLDTVAAVRDWLVAGLAPVPEREPAERALAALVAAVEHIRGVPASVTGTWGSYDLETLTAAQAGMLRARNDP